MKAETTAGIYLVIILCIAIILILVYVCIVKGFCWCFKTKKDNTSYTQVDQEGDTSSATEADSERESDVPTVTSTDFYKSEPDLNRSLLRPPLLTQHDYAASDPAGLAVSAYGDEKKRKFKFRRKQAPISEEEISTNAYLAATLKHSSSDLYLLISIHNVLGLPDKSAMPLTHVCVKLIFLPDKRYSSKTKYNSIERGRIDQSFKFAAVRRADLFQSAVRFRVYGRTQKYGVHLRDKFLGETTVQLADVAQQGGSISIERKLGAKVSY